MLPSDCPSVFAQQFAEKNPPKPAHEYFITGNIHMVKIHYNASSVISAADKALHYLSLAVDALQVLMQSLDS